LRPARSCKSETTDSLLGLRPCRYHPPFALHSNYSGSQIDAALAVLRAHPGQVSPVTIDIGANDLLHGERAAGADGRPVPRPVADPLPVFNPAVNEIPTICKLTPICTPVRDIHASDLGYQQLADLVFAASGY
jgi:hypothetical protein